jgi:hypothetical protein
VETLDLVAPNSNKDAEPTLSMSLFLTNNLSKACRRIVLEGAILLVMTLVVADRDSYSQTPTLSPNPSGNATPKITEEPANMQMLEPAEAIN